MQNHTGWEMHFLHLFLGVKQDTRKMADDFQSVMHHSLVQFSGKRLETLRLEAFWIFCSHFSQQRSAKHPADPSSSLFAIPWSRPLQVTIATTGAE